MLIHRSGRFEMNVEVMPQTMARPTLFIHGNLASNRWWYPSFEIWKSVGRQPPQRANAYLAEWRGCGKSSRAIAESDLDMKQVAAQYVELVSDLGLESVDVVGHSTGGLIALFAMLQEPSMFGRAVLLDPVAPKGFQLNDEMLEAFKAMRQDRRQCEMVMAATIHNVDRTSLLFQGIVDDAFGVDPNIWTGVPKALQTARAMDQMPKIQNSILVLHGELDPILPKADSVELAEALPNGTFQEVAGHGHSLNVEDAKKFTNLVDTFFNTP